MHAYTANVLHSEYPNWKVIEREMVDETEEMVRSGRENCFATAANRLNKYHGSKGHYSSYLSQMERMAFATNRNDTVLRAS